MTTTKQKALREGFTTGTAATAAAMAALSVLLGDDAPSCVRVPMPPAENSEGLKKSEGFGNVACLDADLPIPIGAVTQHDSVSASAFVQKDGGDDPDVTHKLTIHAKVTLTQEHKDIHIDGGEGVGRFTLPGLPLPVGEAAINPAPRRQICAGLRRILGRCSYDGGVDVCIFVPKGVEVARRTLNARLGILGGISILGTHGTVRPYSHEAWQASIAQALGVAHATGCSTVCLSTGRRSEKLLLARYPHISAQGAVQVADFVEFSLNEAGRYGFAHVVWGCFFGKLLKLAQGHGNTHAHKTTLCFATLARWCEEEGVDAPEIGTCVSAHHALECLLAHERALRVIENIMRKAAENARNFLGKPLKLHLFHMDGRELFFLDDSVCVLE